MQAYTYSKNIQSSNIKPVLTYHKDIYSRPHETIRIEFKPIVGAILPIEKEIPAVNAPVMPLK